MNTENINSKIKQIENELKQLPQGSIAKKIIKGKEYFYHRYIENNKRVEKYIDFDSLDDLKGKIEQRRKLEKELKNLKENKKDNNIKNTSYRKNISTDVNIRVGNNLKEFVNPVKKYKMRNCYNDLEQYTYKETCDKCFILYGLRRTGKTTLIRQIILNMSPDTLIKQHLFKSLKAILFLK